MVKVSIPYSTQEGKLHMQPVVWPQQCPCCKSRNVSAEYGLSHKAGQKIVSSTPTQTTSTHYPLNWNVPYCQACLDHIHAASMMGLAAFGIWVVLALILFFALPDPATASGGLRAFTFFLVLGGPILPAWIGYRVLSRRVADSKRKPECIDRHATLSVSSEEGHIIFAFEDDEYGALFAELNGRPLER